MASILFPESQRYAQLLPVFIPYQLRTLDDCFLFLGWYASQSTTSNSQTNTTRFTTISPPSGLFTPCDCSPSSTIGKVTSVHTHSQSQPLAGRIILQMRSCSFKHLMA